MAYDQSLAKRIDGIVKGKKGFASKKMFGGIASGIGNALTSKPVTYQRGAMKKVAPVAKQMAKPAMKGVSAIAARQKAIKDAMKD